MGGWAATFWIAEGLAWYALAGYAILAGALARWLPGPPLLNPEPSWRWPSITIVVAACDEAALIAMKVHNAAHNGYPADLLEILVVADGSSDATARLAREAGARILYDPVRRGKAHAVARGVAMATGEVVVLTDANAMLVPGALCALVRPFADPTVAAVAGAKRVAASQNQSEGRYWRIENRIRGADTAIWSVAGGAGELLAVARDRFPALEPDTILDDFVISMRLVRFGYRVVHAPEAVAAEIGAPDVRGEFERRARIVAGGHQAVFRLGLLLDRPWRVWLPYLSHRALRWVIAPWALLFGLIANIVLAIGETPYLILLAAQVSLWTLGAAGGALLAAGRRPGPLALPWQILLFWLAALAGALRYYTRRQPAAWARVARG